MLRRPMDRPAYRTELLELTRLAAPLAAVQAGNQLMGFVDTAIVGRLGPAALGAVGLGHAIFFAVAVVGMGIMMGLDPLVSQALGARDELRARVLLWQGVWLALIVGGVLSVPVFAVVPLLEVAGIAPEVAAFTRPYLLIRALGMVPLLIFVGARSYLQSVGRTRSLLAAMVAANLFNFFATLLLVFGGAVLPEWAGPLRALPAFGAGGAAAATTLCLLLQLGIVAWALRRRTVPGFGPELRRASRADLAKAFRIGIPIGMQMAAEVGLFTLVAVLAGRLGTNELAAHQIAITLAGFSFCVSLGIGAAGSVRVGRAIGAGDGPGTRRAGLTALGAGGAFMALSALVFFAFPGEFAALLSDSPEVIAAATPLMIVAAFFQISDGIQAVGAGVLRGAGDTRCPFVLNVLGHYLVGVPVAIGLGLFTPMGIIGLWWGLCAGLTVVGFSLLVRFAQISKREIRPLDPAEPDLDGGAEAQELGATS